jgi:hypothetical protein
MSVVVDRFGAAERPTRRHITGLLAVVVVVVLSSCTTTVAGRGIHRFESPSARPKPSSTSNVFPATCSARAIRPPGAPFCYSLPAGYTDSSSRADYSQGWTYRSEVMRGQDALITVAAFDMHQDSDSLSRRALLRGWVGSQRMVVGSLRAVVAAGTMREILVDGARAWIQNVTERYAGQVSNVRVFTVVRGRTLLSLHCQYNPNQPAPLSACQSIADDIQIVSL